MLKTNSVSKNASSIPVVSKMYCSPSQVVLVVRRRPQVTNGGGFVVTDCNQKVVFRVDGSGVLGVKGELVLRDANGDPLLLIRRKGGVVQALSINKKWKGYVLDYEGTQKLVFSLREPTSWLARNGGIRISTEEAAGGPWLCGGNDRDLEIKGYFPERACRIVDAHGNTIAQVEMRKEVMLPTKDLFHVSVKPGVDQAFVVGVIAVLDYIYGQPTTC